MSDIYDEILNASNIQINQNILDDPNLIAASRVDINDYDESSTGDSSNLKYIIENINDWIEEDVSAEHRKQLY